MSAIKVFHPTMGTLAYALAGWPVPRRSWVNIFGKSGLEKIDAEAYS